MHRKSGLFKENIVPSLGTLFLLSNTFLASATNKPSVAVATGIATVAMSIYTGVSVYQTLRDKAKPSLY